MSTNSLGSGVAPTFEVLATLPPAAQLPRKPASRISQRHRENVLFAEGRSTEFPNLATKKIERDSRMTLVARAARSRNDARPLRRALQAGAVVLIAAVGIERLWEGGFWPGDVLGAYALGGLLLVALVALLARLDTAIGELSLIHAAHVPHDETRPHVHALTSLVRFEGDRVAKTYAPGFLPRALYWLAFQAPFPYVRNRAALRAAMHRRNFVALLTEYWYGESRVARDLGVERAADRYSLVGERVVGHAPTHRYVARAFLAGLAARFEEAGLPTWQIDPRQPRAIDNVLETGDGVYKVVDLESGLVSPMASLKTWRRAVRRGLAPFYDEVFFDLTRAYIAREEDRMRARLGAAWIKDLRATLDAAESETVAWRRGEPRLWNRLLTAVVTGFGIRTRRTRTSTPVTESPSMSTPPTPISLQTPVVLSCSPQPQAA
jgi:hypothetical protein